MTITLEFSPQAEALLTKEASRRAVDVNTYARQLVEESLPAPNVSLLRELIQSWIDEGDADEQHDTFDALKTGLNKSHSSYRKVYP